MGKTYKNGRIIESYPIPEKGHEREFYENEFKEKYPELSNSDKGENIMDDYVQKQELQNNKFLEDQKQFWDSEERKQWSKELMEVFTRENGVVYLHGLISVYNELPVSEAIERLKILIYDWEREFDCIRVQSLPINNYDKNLVELLLKKELERQESRLQNEKVVIMDKEEFINKAKNQLEFLKPESLTAYYEFNKDEIKYHETIKTLYPDEIVKQIRKIDPNTIQFDYINYKDDFAELFSLQEKVNNYTFDDYLLRNKNLPEEKIKDFYSFRSHLLSMLNESIDLIKKEIEKLNIEKSQQTYEQLIPIFREYFIDSEKFNNAINDLINKTFIDKTTLVHIDNLKGNKGLFVSALKEFQKKRYYKVKPKSNDYFRICKDAFKIEIGIDTIKRTK